METLAPEKSLRPCLLEIDGQRLLCTSPGFADAISQAHGRRRRPRCLCRPAGVEMYIARWADGYLVKRMPETGALHAPDCQSFEPPAAQSGLHPLLGKAIREDPVTGMTALSLGFSMSSRSARGAAPGTGSTAGSAACGRPRLSLRALLHYLWDQAELTRWHPGFEGRRTWGVVRRQLLQAASLMLACGATLASRLEIPEPFSVEQQEAIEARRRARWALAASAGAQTSKHLLIAEIKELSPGRQGHHAIVKHLPDLAFSLEDALMYRLERLFEHELALWSAARDLRLVMMAILTISPAGLPRIGELSLMCVTQQWLPIDSMAARQLVARLVRERRAFRSLLRYDLRRDASMPTLVLTDQGDPAPVLFADEGAALP